MGGKVGTELHKNHGVTIIFPICQNTLEFQLLFSRILTALPA